MSRRYKQVAAGLCVALAPQAGLAQNDVSELLVSQGQHWEARDDSERAAQTWNKLLLISPDNADALYGLARLDLKAKRFESAQSLLRKLKAAHPDSRFVALLEQDLALNTGNKMAVLEQARLLAASGDLQQAIPKYKEALGDRQPQGEVAREYYNYLGYTPGGLPEALAGLQRLAKQSPDNPQVALSLARHLARNEASRLDGIKMLSRLAARPDIGSDAAESWRDALTWLGPPSPEARPLFDEYLRKHPEDAQIRQQLAKAPAGRRAGAAQSPVAANIPATRKTAAPASAASSPQVRRQPAVQTGHQTNRKADAAIKLFDQTGNSAAARTALEDALREDPSNPWVRLRLAQSYQAAGQTREAKGLIDGLLATDSGNMDAWYASAIFASQNQDWPGAQEALDRIAGKSRTQAIAALQHTVSQQLQIQQALGLGKGGRKAEALRVLEGVQTNAAGDLGVLSAVAQAYVELDEPGRGLALLRPMLGQGKAPSIDASLTYVGLLLQTSQDAEAAGLIRYLQQQKLTQEQRRSLAAIADVYAVRQADSLRERGDLVAAYDTLAPVLARNPNDVAALAALARMYTAAGDGKKALALYEQSLQRDPDNADLHLGAAQAAQQLKDHRYAVTQAEAAVSLAPDRPEVLAGAARIYRAQGKTLQAADLLKRAVALQGGAQTPAGPAVLAPAARSDNPFVGMPGQRQTRTANAATTVANANATNTNAASAATAMTRPEQDVLRSADEVLAIPVAAHNERAMPVRPVAEPAAPGQRAVAAVPANTGRTADYAPYQPPVAAATVVGAASAKDAQAANAGSATGNALGQGQTRSSSLHQELDEIYQERSVQARVGTQFRTRTGDSGTSRLQEAQMPVELNFPVGNDRMNVQVTPVVLSAGSLGGGVYERTTFGDAINSGSNEVPGIKTARGVGLSVGYETGGLKADLGVTPLGFQEKSLTGGLLLDGTLDDAGSVSYRLDLSRRPVTDSVLSFAGMTDERSGAKWGGVSATGGRLTLAKDFGDAGIYGTAAVHSLNGHNVASNLRTELNAGTYFRLIDEPNAKLTAGLNLNATFFNKNLSHFSYGHGGYFSPKNYFALGVPFTWAQRQGKFSYRLDGAIGIQHFKQSDAQIYPTDSAMQTRAQELLAAASIPELGGISNGYYRGQSKTGVGYNLGASAEYRFTPKLVLGASVAADNANDYRQWVAGLYFRYYFHPQTGLMDLPIEPSRSPYGTTYGR